MRTARLLLRPFREADLPSVVGIQSSPETHPHEPSPATPAQARTQFETWRRHWIDHGFGYLAVVEPGPDRLVGVGGIQCSDLDREPVLNLYYRFRPDTWGRGYAPEMGAAVVAWAEREVPERPVVIVTGVTNAPARRVADKLGFREYRRDLYRGLPSVYYRRPGPRGRRPGAVRSP